jgi:flagellar hook protein FlgE
MSMSIGLAGINAATNDLNTTANNIANVSTTGFKDSRAEFGDMVVGHNGSGVHTQAVNQQFRQGNLKQTLNEGQNGRLDLAINGRGFFQVKNVAGTASVDPPIYTRAGSFHTDVNGYVVNNLNQRLQDNAGADVKAPASTTAPGLWANVASTDLDGTITFNDAVPPAPGTTVKVGVYDFPSVPGLQPVGDTEWAETSASGVATLAASPQVQSGYLEESNVDLTAQLVNMIIAQRNFSANAKTITTNSEMTQTIIAMR